MHGRRRIRSIAALSAPSLLVQPLIVLPGGCAQTRAVSAVQAGPSPNVACVATSAVSTPVPFSLLPVAVLPVALVSVTALSPAAIETQRGAIAQIMIQLGEDEDQARQ